MDILSGQTWLIYDEPLKFHIPSSNSTKFHAHMVYICVELLHIAVYCCSMLHLSTNGAIERLFLGQMDSRLNY